MLIQVQGMIGEFQPEGSEFVTDSESLNRALNGLSPNEDVTVKINSPGGSVFEGFNMYNTLKALPNNVTSEISNAMSIATLIALAADKVQMNEVGSFMIHRASSMAMGNAEDMEKEIEVLKSIDDTLVNVYAAKSGKSFDEIKNLMDAETWYTANGTKENEGAFDAGFVDEIINPISEEAAAIFLTKNKEYMNKIQALFTKFRAEVMNESEVEETATEVVELSKEELEAKAKADAEAKAKEEADADPEKAEEPQAQFVTMEVFQAFMKTMEEMVTALQDNQAEAAQKEVDKLKASLKRSNGQPPRVNSSEDGEAGLGWVDPYAKFRTEMKEIDDKTRQKNEN